MQKRLFIFLIGFSFVTAAFGGDKHWEHNVYVDFGAAKSFPEEDSPFALHLGYGLTYYFNKHWSAMPGIAYRAKTEPGDADGTEGDCDCAYLDLPIVAQYHLPLAGRHAFVLELGPVFSLRTENGAYYFDADPDSPLQGEPIYKKFDFGLQPAVYYRTGRHWQFGLKGHLGFLNQSRRYSVPTDSYHFQDLTVSIGFRF